LLVPGGKAPVSEEINRLRTRSPPTFEYIAG
jgi:hypothetical protein